MSSGGATLQGSFSGATGTISETGFYYGISSGNLAKKVSLGSVGTPFTKALSGLMPNTTYYYKAYVVESSQEVVGSVESFITSKNYLHDYGMPDVSGIVTSARDNKTNSARDDHWYSYNTSNNKRQLAVHTYTHPTSDEETATYVVLYDENNYAPLWTAHTMSTVLWPDNNVGRADNTYWTDDPAINLIQQSGLDDASQYSRGHLVASDYRQTSKLQNRQTFYHSNQAPQWQTGFNDGIWATLEQRVAAVAPSGTTMLYVITGVLYEGTITYQSSGSKNVPIPSHFYKCLMQCTFDSSGTMNGSKGIAFLYTNEAHSGNYYASQYVTTINDIESRTGFDFFANVPDSYENAAEANTNHSWFTGQSSPNNTISPVTNNYWWNP